MQKGRLLTTQNSLITLYQLGSGNCFFHFRVFYDQLASLLRDYVIKYLICVLVILSDTAAGMSGVLRYFVQYAASSFLAIGKYSFRKALGGKMPHRQIGKYAPWGRL